MEIMETKELPIDSCLYEDLPLALDWMAPSEYESKMKHDELFREIKELKKEIVSQNSRIEQLELEKSILSRNLLGLLKTAQLELNRKQQIIDELRGFNKNEPS